MLTHSAAEIRSNREMAIKTFFIHNLMRIRWLERVHKGEFHADATIGSTLVL